MVLVSLCYCFLTSLFPVSLGKTLLLHFHIIASQNVALFSVSSCQLSVCLIFRSCHWLAKPLGRQQVNGHPLDCFSGCPYIWQGIPHGCFIACWLALHRSHIACLINCLFLPLSPLQLWLVLGWQVFLWLYQCDSAFSGGSLRGCHGYLHGDHILSS